MLWRKLFSAQAATAEAAAEPEAHEQRAAERVAVFREAQVVIEDYYKIRVVITDLSSTGARIRYASRIDLPSRIRISEPTLKINRWARVVWQRDGAAGLEFVEG